MEIDFNEIVKTIQLERNKKRINKTPNAEKTPTDFDLMAEAINKGKPVKIIVDGTEMIANLLSPEVVEHFLRTYKGEYFIEYC